MNSTTDITFGYQCQECGKGTVVAQVFPEYHTKIKGYPFVVSDAVIGVCDKCGARHYTILETQRWENLFEEREKELYLKPEEIQEVWKSLGLSMEQFAALVGCTRQSLYNWGRPDSTIRQSRMADLMLRLVKESAKTGNVDVLNFLSREAEKYNFQDTHCSYSTEQRIQDICLQDPPGKKAE